MKDILTCLLMWLHFQQLRAAGNPPGFVVPTSSSNTKNMTENVAAETEVLILFAQDDENDPLAYTIETQVPASPVFTLGGNDGDVLRTPAGLDAETTASFNFTFRAHDGNSYTISVVFTLTITDVNDNSPVFSESSYTGSITDGVSAGTTVLTVTATDADITASVTYSITAGDTPSTFSMVGGAITVSDAANVNSTTTPSYTLTVQATDGANPVTASVTISVTGPDPNQNAPMFAGTPYTATIQKNKFDLDGISVIFRVTVTDADPGSDGSVNLSLDAPDATLFEIANFSNTEIDIKVKATITSDQTPYLLVLKATDGGAIPKTSTAILTIHLKTGPKFIKPLAGEKIDMCEDIGENADIYTLEANDTDGVGNLNFQLYNQEPSTPTVQFVIVGTILKTSPTAQGFNDSVFDLEQSSPILQFTLYFSVTDALGHRDELFVTIRIEDANDNSPVFPVNTPVTANILETKEGEILKVTATDADYTSPNNNITYALTGDGHGDFDFDVNIGSVSARGPSVFNYTSRPSYTLTITATDGGGVYANMANVNVTISIDTAPVFTDPTNGKEINMTEEQLPGDRIATLTATDEDGADKGTTLAYSIVSENPSTGLFTINGTSLTIASNANTATYDADSASTVTRYTVDLRVTDGTYNATVIIHIIIIDVNDKDPVFSQGLYAKNISTRIQTGATVITVTAEDGDSTSPNNKVTYSLSVVGSNVFAINGNGDITVENVVSYSPAGYNLTVTATDGAKTGPRSASVLVQINVETAPVFTDPTGGKTINMTEDKVPGDIIATLNATDEDGADKGTSLTYSIVSENPSTSLFTINGTYLTIASNADTTTYDYDTASNVKNYTLELKVTDNTYDETISVTIGITDANDNTPVFSPSSYAKTIDNHIAVGTTVVTVSATDSDASAPNNVVAFSLSGSGSDQFDITTSGAITVKNTVQYSQNGYTLTATATDGAAIGDRRSSTALVAITVETWPVFTKPAAATSINISEDIDFDVPVYNISATDEDSNDFDLVFTIVSHEPAQPVMLYLDGNILRSSKTQKLDTETTPSVLIGFSVTDGNYTVNSTLLTITVSDVNDNSPEFQESAYSKTINENLSNGSTILQITATDADVTSPFNKVTYIISSGNTNALFGISTEDGSLTLTGTPKMNTYYIVVKASDGGTPPKTKEVNVTIIINADVVDECASSPCQNGGTCLSQVNYYYCDCAPGWTGKECNTNIDDCVSVPCKNGGVCIDGVNSFTCNCSESWTGTTCTQACTGSTYGRNCMHTCSCNSSNLAQPAADQTCHVITGACYCNGKWEGHSCNNDTDECRKNDTLCTAVVHQVCQNQIGSYECVCEQGYTANSNGTCIQDGSEPPVIVPVGQLLIEVSMVINVTGCDPARLKIPTVYANIKANIIKMLIDTLTSTKNETIHVKNISCGSIVFDAEIVAYEEDVGNTAMDFQNIRNGMPLQFNNETVTASTIKVSGKELTVNSQLDPAAQLCEVYTLIQPCLPDYQCRIQSGIRYCKYIEKDTTALILGIGLGVPLPLILLLIVMVACLYRKGRQLSEKRRKRSPEIDSSTSHQWSVPRVGPSHHNRGLKPFSHIKGRRDYNQHYSTNV